MLSAGGMVFLDGVQADACAESVVHHVNVLHFRFGGRICCSTDHAFRLFRCS